MFNICILEDDIRDREHLRNLIDQVIYEEHVQGRVQMDTDSPREIQQLIEGGYPLNVFFLDISIRGKPEGFELAKFIYERVDNGFIIFISEKLDFVFHSFRVKAFDFIPKPASKNSIQRVFKELEMSVYKKKWKDIPIQQREDVVFSHPYHTKEGKIALKCGTSLQYIQPEKLTFIEQQRNKAIYKLEKECVFTYETLESIYKNLERFKIFIRTHRSFIVNRTRIQKINFSKRELTMDTGDICPIGIRYKDVIKNLSGIFQKSD